MPPIDPTAVNALHADGERFSRIADLVGNSFSLAQELEAAGTLESAWQSQEEAFRVEDPLADLFIRIADHLRLEAEFNAEREAQAIYFQQLGETLPTYDDSARLAIATQHGMVGQSSTSVDTIWGDVHAYFSQSRLEHDRFVEADRSRSFAIQLANHFGEIEAARMQAAIAARIDGHVSSYFDDPAFDGLTEAGREYVEHTSRGISENGAMKGATGIEHIYEGTSHAQVAEEYVANSEAMLNRLLEDESILPTDAHRQILREVIEQNGGVDQGIHSHAMLAFLRDVEANPEAYTDLDAFRAELQRCNDEGIALRGYVNGQVVNGYRDFFNAAVHAEDPAKRIPAEEAEIRIGVVEDFLSNPENYTNLPAGMVPGSQESLGYLNRSNLPDPRSEQMILLMNKAGLEGFENLSESEQRDVALAQLNIGLELASAATERAMPMLVAALEDEHVIDQLVGASPEERAEILAGIGAIDGNDPLQREMAKHMLAEFQTEEDFQRLAQAFQTRDGRAYVLQGVRESLEKNSQSIVQNALGSLAGEYQRQAQDVESAFTDVRGALSSRNAQRTDALLAELNRWQQDLGESARNEDIVRLYRALEAREDIQSVAGMRQLRSDIMGAEDRRVSNIRVESVVLLGDDKNPYMDLLRQQATSMGIHSVSYDDFIQYEQRFREQHGPLTSLQVLDMIREETGNPNIYVWMSDRNRLVDEGRMSDFASETFRVAGKDIYNSAISAIGVNTAPELRGDAHPLNIADRLMTQDGYQYTDEWTTPVPVTFERNGELVTMSVSPQQANATRSVYINSQAILGMTNLADSILALDGTGLNRASRDALVQRARDMVAPNSGVSAAEAAQMMGQMLGTGGNEADINNQVVGVLGVMAIAQLENGQELYEFAATVRDINNRLLAAGGDRKEAARIRTELYQALDGMLDGVLPEGVRWSTMDEEYPGAKAAIANLIRTSANGNGTIPTEEQIAATLEPFITAAENRERVEQAALAAGRTQEEATEFATDFVEDRENHGHDRMLQSFARRPVYDDQGNFMGYIEPTMGRAAEVSGGEEVDADHRPVAPRQPDGTTHETGNTGPIVN